jgi:hypothetical protein
MLTGSNDLNLSDCPGIEPRSTISYVSLLMCTCVFVICLSVCLCAVYLCVSIGLCICVSQKLFSLLLDLGIDTSEYLVALPLSLSLRRLL